MSPLPDTEDRDATMDRPLARPGYALVTPSLTVRDAARALEFYPAAFGAVIRYALREPDGKIAHAELEFGDSVVMISDEYPDWGALSPESIGGTAGKLMIYVPDADAALARAEAAGGTIVMPAQDHFYGDRSGQVRDPFGHTWTLAQWVEDVPPEEIQRRFAAWMSGGNA